MSSRKGNTHCVGSTREVLLKRKARYSWPPYTNLFSLAPIYVDNIFKRATLKRRSTVLSFPPLLEFLGSTVGRRENGNTTVSITTIRLTTLSIVSVIATFSINHTQYVMQSELSLGFFLLCRVSLCQVPLNWMSWRWENVRKRNTAEWLIKLFKLFLQPSNATINFEW